jgi:O-antigen/teichoic acid export membrane protein
MNFERGNARLVKNAAANLSRLATGWLAVLVMPPILVRSLDASTYATWMLILQLAAYSTVFESALQMATARFVAYSEGLGDRHMMGKMVSSSALLLAAMGAIVLLVLAVVVWKLGSLFPSVPVVILPQMRTALVITAASLAICLPLSALAGTYVGLQRNEIPALINGTTRVVGTGGAIWAAIHHQGLIVMALWTAGGAMLQPLLYLLLPHRSMWQPLLRIGNIDKLGFVEFGKFCSAAIVSQFGTMLITGMDLPLVAAFDFKSLAYYSVATTLSTLLLVPHGAIVSTIMPVVASIVGEGSERRRGDILLRTTRIANALLYLIALPLLLGVRDFLTLWVGSEYANHAITIGVVLVLAQCIRLTLLPYALVGFSAGQQSLMLISPFAEGLGNLIFSFILVRRMGAPGVAIGTICGAVLGVALHFMVSMPRTNAVQFSRSRLFLDGILRPAFYPALIAVVFVTMVRFTPTILGRSVLLVIAEIGLACSLWLVFFTPQERSSLRGIIGRKLVSTATVEA